MNIKKYKIASFEHFISILNHNNNDTIRLFRGQKEDLPLYSKLYRNAIKFGKTNDVYKIEKKILSELKERIINDESNNLRDLDLMILAQHYGLPTRLLDWTSNPFVALWFAFELSKPDDDSRVVWGLKIEPDSLLDFQNESPFNIRFVKVFRPPVIDIRILAQKSWFSIQDIQFFERGGDGLPNLHTNNPIEDNEDFDFYLAKFIFPNTIRPEVLKKLAEKGVTRSSIYPDLSEICEQLMPSEFQHKKHA